MECPECGDDIDEGPGFASHWGQLHEGPVPEHIDTSRSEETKQKISAGVSENHHDVSGEKNPMYGVDGEDAPGYGRDVSEETSEKIRQSKLGVGRSEETKRKLSESHTGKTLSEEHRQKLSRTFSGRKVTWLEGENHPMWKGGTTNYPDEWTHDLKELVRQLYYRSCQLCGIHESELDRKLDVHHMDGDKQNCELSNLYPFCRSCHGVVEYEMETGRFATP